MRAQKLYLKEVVPLYRPEDVGEWQLVVTRPVTVGQELLTSFPGHLVRLDWKGQVVERTGLGRDFVLSDVLSETLLLIHSGFCFGVFDLTRKAVLWSRVSEIGTPWKDCLVENNGQQIDLISRETGGLHHRLIDGTERATWDLAKDRLFACLDDTGGEVVAVDLESRDVVWRRSIVEAVREHSGEVLTNCVVAKAVDGGLVLKGRTSLGDCLVSLATEDGRFRWFRQDSTLYGGLACHQGSLLWFSDRFMLVDLEAGELRATGSSAHELIYPQQGSVLGSSAVFTGEHGQISAFDIETGSETWSARFRTDEGHIIPFWGSCVVGDTVYVPDGVGRLWFFGTTEVEI